MGRALIAVAEPFIFVVLATCGVSHRDHAGGCVDSRESWRSWSLTFPSHVNGSIRSQDQPCRCRDPRDSCFDSPEFNIMATLD